MRKPSRSQLVFMVIVAALLGVGIYFTVVAVQQVRAGPSVEKDIAQVQRQITTLTQRYDIDALEAELAGIEEELEEAPFPKADAVENVEVHDLVIDAGHEAGVQGLSYIPAAPTTGTIGGGDIEYKVLTYAVEVSATELSGLYYFLDEIERNTLNLYETLVIDHVSMVYVPGTETVDECWTMSVHVVVYAQP